MKRANSQAMVHLFFQRYSQFHDRVTLENVAIADHVIDLLENDDIVASVGLLHSMKLSILTAIMILVILQMRHRK